MTALDAASGAERSLDLAASAANLAACFTKPGVEDDRRHRRQSKLLRMYD